MIKNSYSPFSTLWKNICKVFHSMEKVIHAMENIFHAVENKGKGFQSTPHKLALCKPFRSLHTHRVQPVGRPWTLTFAVDSTT
jgi:hypothetical protein